MKNILKIVLLMIIAVIPALSQTWEWVTPKPQGNNLSSVVMNSNTEGFAVGHLGTIMKTTDMGATWQVQNTPTKKNDIGYYICMA